MIRCLTLNTLFNVRRLSVDITNFQSVSFLSTYSRLNVCNKNNCSKLLTPNILQTEFTRSSGTSFFTKTSAQRLWAGVTGVSNAGRKRGRGKGAGRKLMKDLNRGQIIGVGPTNMVWPGLNAPVLRGKEVIAQTQLPPDTEREAKLIKLRDQLGRFRPLKLTPLERGWSGAKMHGRKCGPPDDIGQDKFEGFDTVILEMKTVCTLDGNIGKVRRYSCMCFTGNKNGLGGVALGRSPEGRAAIRRARNKAGQKLLYFPRFNNRTIMHDFFSQFGATKIFVEKRQEGYGITAHRAIKSICQLLGITDIYAKIEGQPKNVQHVTKAFLLGLLRQKTPDQLAKAKGLFLVEQREECFNFPVVIGVPDRCLTDEEVLGDETMDFNRFAMDGKVPLKKKTPPPFYVKDDYGWGLHLLKTERYRNHYDTRVRLLAEFGGRSLPRSHLTKDYPEAHHRYAMLLEAKKKRERAAAEAAADEE